jgi:hypothetical protein
VPSPAEDLGAPTVASGPTWRDVVAVALIAMVLAGAAATWWFSSVVGDLTTAADPAVDGRRIAAIYDPPDRPVEAALNRGDGQLFAALATDPAVRRPEQVRGPASEQAYRYQRMAYGWLGWAASGGRSEAAPWALIAVTVASVGMLVGAGGLLLLDRGVDPRAALLLALQPAVFIDLTWIGPEVLGTALAVLGLVLWTRRPEGSAALGASAWGAVACFAAAGLCRETLLLIPATMVVHELWHRRWRVAAALAVSAAPYVAWVLVLRLHLGAWPSGSVSGRLSPVPFAGMVAAMSGWGAGDLVVAALILGPAVVALALAGPGLLRLLVATNLAFASLLGEPVWTRWPDFSRVLLPLSTLAVLAIVIAVAGRRARNRAPSGNLEPWSNVPPPAPSPTPPAPTSSRMPTAG